MGLKHYILFTVTIVLSVTFNIKGQDNTEANIDIFDKTISVALEDYFFSPGIDRTKAFVFIIKGAGKDRSDYMTRLIKKTAANDKINVSFSDDDLNVNKDSVYMVSVILNKLSVNYAGFVKNNFLGEKTVRRIVTIDMILKTDSPLSETISDKLIQATKEDAVNMDLLDRVETSQYKFTSARHPEISSFEQIFVPVLLITASAVAVILFFAVRTK